MSSEKNSHKTVLLVEDDEATRLRLAQAINAHQQLSVAHTCSTFTDGLQVLSAHPPDVLVTDLGLPDGTGIDLIRTARSSDKTIEIMVISVFGDERNVLAAIKAGASGYLLKDGDTAYIGDAIMKLLAGESPISPAIARHLLKQYRTGNQNTSCATKNQETHVPKLTCRETDVLRYMAKGYTYNEAADLLGISHHTIASHVKKIYRKLEVNSRSEAVYEALQLGLVNIQP